MCVCDFTHSGRERERANEMRRAVTRCRLHDDSYGRRRVLLSRGSGGCYDDANADRSIKFFYTLVYNKIRVFYNIYILKYERSRPFALAQSQAERRVKSERI